MLSGKGRFACEPACEVEAPLCTIIKSLLFQGIPTFVSSILLCRNSVGPLGESVRAGMSQLGRTLSLNLTAEINLAPPTVEATTL